MSPSRNRSITMNSIASRSGWVAPDAPGLCLGRGGLPLRLWQARIEAGPCRGRLRPDDGGGFGEARIIERSCAHDDLMRTRLGLAEQGRAALCAEAPVHRGAAVGS